jgi:phage terminase small subunit
MEEGKRKARDPERPKEKRRRKVGNVERPPIESKLNSQEKKACRNYLNCPVRSKAFLDAGYSGGVQEAIAFFSRKEILDYIDYLAAVRLDEEGIKEDTPGKNLNEQEKLVCQRYIETHNRRKAWVAAGHIDNLNSQKSAQRFFSRQEVMQYVEHLAEKRRERIEVSGEKLIAELSKIAFVNIQDIMDWNDDQQKYILKTPSQMSEDAMAAIAEISESDIKGAGGAITRGVKLHPKLPAIKMLLHHLGADLSPNELLTRVRGLGYEVVDKRHEQNVILPTDSDDDFDNDDDLPSLEDSDDGDESIEEE